MLSPLTGKPALFKRKISKDQIIDALGNHFKETVNDELNIISYSMYYCTDSTLEFSYPAIPGSENFYKWLSNHPKYYPAERWEYREVIDLISKQFSYNDKFKVLDIGCGDGSFLKLLRKKFPNALLFGIDTNPDVLPDRNSGIDARSCELNEFVKRKEEFDFVTVFHCLEHVDNILNFLYDLKRVVKSRGDCFISVPASPMYFESIYFDVLNHPPHHMSRWNKKAFSYAGKLLNMKVKCYCSERISFFQRMQITLGLNGVIDPYVGKKKFLFAIGCHFPLFVKLFAKQFVYSFSPERCGTTLLTTFSKNS